MYITHEENRHRVSFSLIDDSRPRLKTITHAYAEIDYYPSWWLLEALNSPNKQIIYFHSFGTIYGLRGRGYGRKLLKDVKQYYKGCIVYLGVGALGELTNEQLIEFYKSEGFKLIEEAKRYVSYPVMAIEL